jgi:ATP-dependent RNA helicase HelY
VTAAWEQHRRPGDRVAGASAVTPSTETLLRQVVGGNPDHYQLEAAAAIDRHQSVVVSAPTGSGKTAVAEHAVARVLAAGGKAFYTTPLKALSNQKYLQLRARYGEQVVGLLTGDVSHRGEAPVVVMTTEVLRNMLFGSSPLLNGLGLVVLDEVHYLQDPARGSVWEEVVILLPPEVTLVCLSATVANADQLGAWIEAVHGPTAVVVETQRPVALHHHLAVGRRGQDAVDLLPVLRGGSLHPEAARLDQRVSRLARQPGGFRRSPLVTPRRTELVEALAARAMTPAIVFIFSRAACEDAVAQCVGEGIRLTTPEQRAEIRRRCEEHTEGLPDDELAVLGYGPWSAALEAGVGAHHAGLIPAFRETVESCFADGLLGVVFATETLSLGINMPARTVVVERLTKVRSEGRSALTAGEYAQLTGRAGRRGIDPVGHAVVPWSPHVLAADVGRLAVRPPAALQSSFRPTYNLACNLVRRYPKNQVHSIVDRSFAQFLDQRHHRRLAGRLDRMIALLDRWGYVDRARWSTTDRGEVLGRISHECDLLVAEACTSGVFDDLDPPALAATVSLCSFEHRLGRSRSAGEVPGPARRAVAELLELAEQLHADEVGHDIPASRSPDAGFADAAWHWARRRPLHRVLERCELAPGDFVRHVRLLSDLLRQLAVVAPEQRTRAVAAEAARELERGVAATALPEPVGADEPLGAGASVVVGGAVDASEAAADGGPGAPAATVRLLLPPSP